MTENELGRLCHRLVEHARAAGADHAEAIASSQRAVESRIENDDLHTVETAEETTFGIRVLVGRAVGFLTANRTDDATLRRSAEEAVAQARVTPPDPNNAFPEPEPVTPIAKLWDPESETIDPAFTAEAAARLLERVRALDERVRVDSGAVSVTASTHALVSTTGIELYERQSLAHASLFGMAVEGDDVASFDYDGDSARAVADLEGALHAIAERFVAKCTAGLGAGKGKSFKGSIVLSPEAVTEFLLPTLIAAVCADAVRKGRSPLAGKLGEPIAVEALSLWDDATIPGGVASSSFDREGTSTRRCPIVEKGVLAGYLYNHYEACAAGDGAHSTGHASGDASSLPGIAPTYLEIAPGTVALDDLCSDGPVIWVGRFSGSTNPVTGEFSGVVKNGVLVENGRRKPVRETLIAGNVFEALRRISAISRERRMIEGTRLVPALRMDGVSVTAG